MFKTVVEFAKRNKKKLLIAGGVVLGLVVTAVAVSPKKDETEELVELEEANEDYTEEAVYVEVEEVNE